MRLTTLFTALRNATSDIWRMHDFNYQLPKDQRQENELLAIMKNVIPQDGS